MTVLVSLTLTVSISIVKFTHIQVLITSKYESSTIVWLHCYICDNFSDFIISTDI